MHVVELVKINPSRCMQKKPRQLSVRVENLIGQGGLVYSTAYIHAHVFCHKNHACSLKIRFIYIPISYMFFTFNESHKHVTMSQF